MSRIFRHGFTWLTLLVSASFIFASAACVVAEDVFSDAVAGRVLVFPRDHGKHPDFQTEWWYFTGNVSSEASRFGFQLTFFRRSLVKNPPQRKSKWAVRDLYPAHFALTDATNSRFFHDELISREHPDLAGAADDALDVRIKDWGARRQGDHLIITARSGAYSLRLKLTPEKPVVLHGDRGFSRKGNTASQASYYYSFTRLRASGTVTFDGKSHDVTGLAWMDHEFGSSILLDDQSGWDWFSIQLDDGTDLMLFYLRKKDGAPERTFGTLVHRDGTYEPFRGEPADIRATATWTSPRSNATYPAQWRITYKPRNLDLVVRPALNDQELVAEKSTGTVYWEGAVNAEGTHGNVPVRGAGYVELTGYAHSMAGKL